MLLTTEPAMYSRLRDIRERIGSRLGHGPEQSYDHEQDINRAINEALIDAVTQLPWYFRRTEHFRVSPHVVMASDEDTLIVAEGDQWALETNLTRGAAGSTVWEADRRWAGRAIRMRSSADDDWVENEIREVWEATSARGDVYRISLKRPWQGATTGIQWEVLVGDILFPPDMVALTSLEWNDSGGRLRAKVDSLDATRIQFSADVDPIGYYYGPPLTLARMGYREIPAPRVAPTATLAEQGGATWTGPEPHGTFEYAITRRHGKRTKWYPAPSPRQRGDLVAAEERLLPYLESGLSQASSEVVVAATGSPAPIITFPNYEAILGFAATGTSREGRSGEQVGIWRRRKTDPTETVEPSNHWVFLDEVDAGAGTYIDTGTVVADTLTPYRSVGARSAYRAPALSEPAELVAHIVARPAPLLDDSDTVPLPPEAVKFVIQQALAYRYEAESNPTEAERALGRAQRIAASLSDAAGSGKPATGTLLVKPFSVD